jgi:N-acyl-D-amino-acid deacylase
LLLDNGADPNSANASGATALMWAIPDVAKVKVLMAHGANVNSRSADLKRTPFLIAAGYPGSVEILQLLVDAGADIHAKDRAGMHALGRAMVSADLEVVRFLVEHGCDPKEQGYETNPRRYARFVPSIEFLTTHGAPVGPNAIAVATARVAPSVLGRWIMLGADVNSRTTSYLRTPLMAAAAAEGAGPDTLKLLLDNGADPNLETTEGERALDWAIYRADKGKIEILRQYGATRGHGPRQRDYPPPPQDRGQDPRTALSRSVTLLLKATPTVYEKRGCISCHNQTLPAQLAAVAKTKGVPVDEAMEQKNLASIVAAYQSGLEAAMQGDFVDGANVLPAGYVLTALATASYPLGKLTAAFSHLISATQMPDGSWIGNGISRPPLEDSAVSMTAMAVRALTLYSIPGMRSTFDEKVHRAQQWLLTAEVHSAEERNMRLLGLVWSKASQRDIRAAVQQLVQRQEPDGGWSQLDQLTTDAYATGLSLYALHEAGVPVTDNAYRKGVAYLLRQQYPDGSWLVKTRAFPQQPYFESGYPFGSNQWISAAGASWASLAIAYSLPDAQITKGSRR